MQRSRPDTVSQGRSSSVRCPNILPTAPAPPGSGLEPGLGMPVPGRVRAGSPIAAAPQTPKLSRASLPPCRLPADRAAVPGPARPALPGAAGSTRGSRQQQPRMPAALGSAMAGPGPLRCPRGRDGGTPPPAERRARPTGRSGEGRRAGRAARLHPRPGSCPRDRAEPGSAAAASPAAPRGGRRSRAPPAAPTPPGDSAPPAASAPPADSAASAPPAIPTPSAVSAAPAARLLLLRGEESCRGAGEGRSGVRGSVEHASGLLKT